MTISVLLPSRGRPASLARAVSSLAYGDVEIIVGLDSDDPTAGEAWAAIRSFPSVRVVTSDRHETTAQLFNHLQKKATGDWFVPFPDDYTVDQPNWAELLHSTVEALPSFLGVGYLWDPMYPHFATFPVMSQKQIDMQGFFLPPFFPFLFGDTWCNEVGVLSGMIRPSEASVTIQPGAGHEHKFRDMKLWSDLFHKLRPMRENTAIKMLREAFGRESEEGAYLITTVKERSDICVELQALQRTDEFYKKWDDTGFVHPDYAAVRSKAVAFMEQA